MAMTTAPNSIGAVAINGNDHRPGIQWISRIHPLCIIHSQARQLESLIRLSEARARIDLREEVTKEDAEVRESTIL